MRSITFMTGLVALLFGCMDVGSGRIDGFRSLSTSAWGYQVSEGVTRAGTQAQRFEVRPGDCGQNEGWSDCATDRERSEIHLRRHWAYGDNTWIGFSVFLPSDFQTSARVRTTVGQIHQHGAARSTAGGFASVPPVMQLEMLGNRYFMNVHILSGTAENARNDVREFFLTNVSDMRGRWTDIVINFDTSNGNEVLRVYVNGTLRGEIEDWIAFRPEYYYFKYGIYRSFVSRQNGPMPTQVLFYDEVRMGASMADVLVNEETPVD